MLFLSILRREFFVQRTDYLVDFCSKCEKMPADNDNVESGVQIAMPSSPALSSGQPTSPIYHQVITYNFPPPIPMKCHGDVAGNWDFSSSNGAIMR